MKTPANLRIVVSTLVLCAGFLTEALGQMPATGPLIGKVVASGLRRPLYIDHAPGDNDRLFIVEQRELTNNANAVDTARIKIYKKSTGMVNPAHFLTISVAGNHNERGLLGLAFHPDYSTNGYFYVNFNEPTTGTTIIRRYTVSSITGNTGTADAPGPDIADHDSAVDILSFTQPGGNHNGGWLGFHPDPATGEEGYLYISTGDGGGAHDDDAGHTAGLGNAQDITGNLLGKILRIDINGDDFPPAGDGADYAIPASNPFVGITGDDEIFHYGLRNPWRCSFDRLTNDFYIGDVGQGQREEVDFAAASNPGGENYGWRLREGFIETDDGNNEMVGGVIPGDLPARDGIPAGEYAPGTNTNPADGSGEPILDYQRTLLNSTPIINGEIFGRSITGGYVYRGPSMPWLQGTYFFGEAISNKLSSLRYDGTTITEWTDRTVELKPATLAAVTEVTSFGEDAAGELYFTSNDSSNDAAGVVIQITQEDFYLWRNSQFTVAEINDLGVSGFTADGEPDGMTVLEEFTVGRDPTVSDGPLPLNISLDTDGGADVFLTLELIRDPQSFDSVTISGESGAGLTNGDFDNANTTPLIDDPNTFKFRDNAPMSTADRRFGRFHFELQ